MPHSSKSAHKIKLRRNPKVKERSEVKPNPEQTAKRQLIQFSFYDSSPHSKEEAILSHLYHPKSQNLHEMVTRTDKQDKKAQNTQSAFSMLFVRSSTKKPGSHSRYGKRTEQHHEKITFEEGSRSLQTFYSRKPQKQNQSYLNQVSGSSGIRLYNDFIQDDRIEEMRKSGMGSTFYHKKNKLSRKNQSSHRRKMDAILKGNVASKADWQARSYYSQFRKRVF